MRFLPSTPEQKDRLDTLTKRVWDSVSDEAKQHFTYGIVVEKPDWFETVNSLLHFSNYRGQFSVSAQSIRELLDYATIVFSKDVTDELVQLFEEVRDLPTANGVTN